MALLTFSQLIGRIQMLCNEQIDYHEARAVLDDQYRAFFTEHEWTFSKIETRLTTRAGKTDGTVTVTQDSPTVVGDSTGFDANDLGSFILLPDGRYYEIGGVDPGSQTLTLGKPSFPTNYVDATKAAQKYTLFLHRYTLDTDVESLISITAKNWTLEEKRQSTLNDIDPQRVVDGEPTSFAYIDPDPVTGATRIELWPIPLVAYSFPYVGLKRASLDSSGQLLPDLSEALLMCAAATGCNIAFLKTGKEQFQSARDYYGAAGQDRLHRVLKRDRRRFGKDDIIRGGAMNRFLGATNLDIGPWGRW
jgi:hypothetical protein